MQTVLIDTTYAYRIAQPHYQRRLLAAVREAAQRARRLQRPVLVSVTLPVAVFDAVQAFSAARLAGLGECFMWEQVTGAMALVGAGTALVLETHGPARFADAARSWNNLLADAVLIDATSEPEHPELSNAGPLLFGGFAFDPLHPKTALWSSFPDGLLILPLVLLRQDRRASTLTVNSIVHPIADVNQCATEMEEQVARLLEAIEGTFLQRPDDAIYQMALHDALPASIWKKLVADTVQRIRAGAYGKVVLARSVEVLPDPSVGAFNISATLFRLRESYPNACIFALQRSGRFFIGATPERLVKAHEGRIQTMALAGSARRGVTAEEDAHLGMELLQSVKNNVEHEIVVTRIQETLQVHCTDIDTSASPRLLRLKNVQHLETPISATLLPGHSLLDVLAHLHPTPAVGGVPCEDALAAIRESEQLDRGWYAGPLGWLDARGQGDFVVALRSGLVERERATLFAGCGIVADSDPESEYIESCLKLQAMLRGLGRRTE
jgi:isochorismate synthase